MSKICISCGAVLDDHALFCDDCGTKQDVSQMERESMAEEPQLKQSKMGIAALVMGVIAIVLLGSFFVFDILGIIFGIVGMRKKDTKTGFAKAGLILSIIATVIIIIVMAVAIIFGW